jgi:hypothetical protein
VVVGLSRNDPKTALAVTFQQDEGFYKDAGQTLAVVNNAVNLLGLKGVEEIFTSMSARSDISQTAKGEFFKILVNKRLPLLQKGTNPSAEVLGWFESHIGNAYVSAGESSRIVGEAAKANPAATMSWLESQSDRLTPIQATAALSVAARELQTQSPQQLSAWLASHLDHPQRDGVIEAATNALIQAGDLAGASRMSNTIGNVENHNRVTATVRAAAEQKQPAR